MTAYDGDTLASLIAYVTAPAPNMTTRGRRLQCLAEWLLAQADGVEVKRRNRFNAAGSQEVDLWADHQQHVSGVPVTDLEFPIECKNEEHPTTSGEINEFVAKIENSGGREGLLITRSGIAGTQYTHAHREISLALSRGIVVLVLRLDDIMGMASTDDLVSLLLERRRELRTEQTYVSI